ncbi:hypothetical protein F5Y18DRAFT_118179 [Xylariaceae sp. FL1019]|nr:hypothetical protein F5Y18DRAFT_118179 [Xylariaceae sp. FL1019]
MTAVASPPTFPQHNRTPWGINGMNGMNGVNSTANGNSQIMQNDDLNRLLMSRKPLQRNNSSSSISSASSASSTSTVATSTSNPNSQQSNGIPASPQELNPWPNGANAAQRKRPQPKGPWPNPKPEPQNDFVRMTGGRQMALNTFNGASPLHAAPSIVPSQGQMASQQAVPRPMSEALPPGNPAVLYLLSLNGTFERKTISVPFSPDILRIGRQTNAKTVPTPINGFFDSKVLSRQHAEIWADRQGKVWIRDVKSSNGTFVNGTRLSQENRESEPHELQTGDHLELGIDIVSEDQKTVVHHKVAAKVEHAGYPSPSNNVMDLNFGDLDPANGPHMMMGAQGAVPLRRAGSQSSINNNGGRMGQGPMMGPQPNGIANQRGFFFSPISTEQIVKKLQAEMRNARLQSNDLGHAGNFVHALLSKEDIKNDKPEAPEPVKSNMVNGNGISFRTDGKTRFSEPPAPPPQQPLPEKPDVPSLRRGLTEKAKTNGHTSPVRQDMSGSQILALTEALTVAKKEIESQTSRMRDLEEMLQQERRARELAEELARRLEEQSADANTAGSSTEAQTNGTTMEAAFESPPTEEVVSSPVDTPMVDAADDTQPNPDVIEISAAQLHAQLQAMVQQIADLRQQVDGWKQRAETAESERDTDRKSLAEMAIQIRRAREAEELAATQHKAAAAAASLSKKADKARNEEILDSGNKVKAALHPDRAASSSAESLEPSTLSRTPNLRRELPASAADPPKNLLASSVPYTSMTVVVLFGLGLMAYINGLQTQPKLER